MGFEIRVQGMRAPSPSSPVCSGAALRQEGRCDKTSASPPTINVLVLSWQPLTSEIPPSPPVGSEMLSCRSMFDAYPGVCRVGACSCRSRSSVFAEMRIGCDEPSCVRGSGSCFRG